MTVIEVMEFAKRWLSEKENEGWNLTDFTVFATVVANHVRNQDEEDYHDSE